MVHFERQTGFSLVEVVVAISVLLILTTAFAPMVSQAFAEVFRAGRKSQAIQEAETEVEGIKSSGDAETAYLQFAGAEDIQVRVISGEWGDEREKVSVTVIVLDEEVE